MRNRRNLNRVVIASLVVAAGCVSSAGAQTSVYEGFDYPAPSVLLGGNGGVGFTVPWGSAGYGAWGIDSTDSLYAKSGLQLQTSGGRAVAALGGAQRDMALATPIGDAPGTTWMSFVARQASGDPANSWLGVKMPCSGGANPFLFIGKPFGMTNWGTDAGLGGTIRQSTTASTTQAFIVVRLVTRAGADDVAVWINPPLSGTLAVGTADLVLPAYGDFAGITKLLVETGSLGGGVASSGVLDELRVSSDQAGVMPTKPGVIASGISHVPVGAAQLERSADGRRVRAHNLGSSGQDGVEVKARSLVGSSIGVDTGSTPGTVERKHKGWDGLIYHRSVQRTTGPGEGDLTVDFSGLGATGVRTIEYDDANQVISDVFTPGPIVNKPWVPYGPCPDGTWPALQERWYWSAVTQNYVVYYIWVCPAVNGGNDTYTYEGRRMVVIPETPVGTGPIGIDSVLITSPDLPEVVVAEASLETFGVSSYGVGDALIHEECDDGNDCADVERRKVVVTNIGSSGNDGVNVDWRTSAPPAGGSVSLGDILNSTGEADINLRKNYVGHVTLIKQRVRGNGDGTGVISPDFSGVGATEFVVTAYANGQVVHQETLPNGTGIPVSVDQVVCGPNSVIVYGWVTMWVWNPWPITGSYQTYWGVVGCMNIGGGGGNTTYTDRIVFSPVNPVSTDNPTGVDIFARGISDITVLDVEALATIPCPADFNGDGFTDFFDFDDFVIAFENGLPTADVNGDGFIDFFDFDDFVTAFELGC
jgi:hypothetical protein